MGKTATTFWKLKHAGWSSGPEIRPEKMESQTSKGKLKTNLIYPTKFSKVSDGWHQASGHGRGGALKPEVQGRLSGKSGTWCFLANRSLQRIHSLETANQGL